jgi:hypothetical protein
MISITPDTLIATCSVLIDLTFRRELYRDRIWTQITLWLSVSLQDMIARRYCFNGIFAMSIISCTYAVLLLRWSYFLGASDYTRLLAPSLLITLFCDTFFRQSRDCKEQQRLDYLSVYLRRSCCLGVVFESAIVNNDRALLVCQLLQVPSISRR